MRRTRMIPLLTAAIVAVAVGLASGCGSGEKLIPPAQATALDSALQQVTDATRNGECQQANDALGSAQRAYQALPASVDDGLKARLRQGLQQLTDTVPDQCKAAAGTTQPTTTKSTATTTTTEPTTTTTTTTEPTTTTTTTTEPPPTTTTTTPTSTDPNGGVAPDPTTSAQTDAVTP